MCCLEDFEMKKVLLFVYLVFNTFDSSPGIDICLLFYGVSEIIFFVY